MSDNDDRRTVLAVHPSPDGYGADLQLVQTVAALVEGGWRVLVVLPHPGALVDRLTAAGAETAFIDYPVLRKASASPAALARLLLAAVACLPRAVRLVRRARPAVLLVNTVTLPWWLLVGRLTRTPTIGYVHEAETSAGWLVRRGLLAPLLLADAVIVISVAVRAATITAQPRLAGRTRLIYNGVPSAPAPVAPPARSRPIRLAVVGRLSPRKAPHVVLEAMRRIGEGHDVEVELAGTTFAGYEWYEAQLRETAATPELAGRVHFSGYCSPIWPVLERADIVVAPSLHEPFGNVVVEAQLAGRPVVASAAYGHLESITDFETGLLVPPGDVEALAEALRRLITDPALAARLGEQARAAAVRRFSVSRYRRQIAELVYDVTLRSGRPPQGSSRSRLPGCGCGRVPWLNGPRGPFSACTAASGGSYVGRLPRGPVRPDHGDGPRVMIPEGLSTGPGGWGDRKPADATHVTVGYVPGAWDMFHVGHLNILLRAREQCDRLVVGVVTDEALQQAKGKLPVIPLDERVEVIRHLAMVDDVVVDFSSRKLAVWERVRFDVLFKGDDWRGTPKGDRLEAEMASVGVQVSYFPYTPHTSSSQLRERLGIH